MAGKRMLAVLAAVIMVVGAVAIRSWIDDGGEISLDGTPAPIVCDELIADQCRVVFGSRATSAAPGDTLDDLLREDREPFIWIAASVWFDILADPSVIGVGDAALGSAETLAHSPLVLANDDFACVPVDWTCVASADGSLGLTSIDQTSGLVARGQLVGVVLLDPSFAANDPGFDDWEQRLGPEIVTRSDDFALTASLNAGGQFDAFSVVDALIPEAQRDRTINLLGPDIEIGVVAVNGAALPRDFDDLTGALVDSGWERGPGAEVEGPSGGALQALRTQ